MVNEPLLLIQARRRRIRQLEFVTQLRESAADALSRGLKVTARIASQNLARAEVALAETDALIAELAQPVLPLKGGK